MKIYSIEKQRKDFDDIPTKNRRTKSEALVLR